jgi:hypothetical protein
MRGWHLAGRRGIQDEPSVNVTLMNIPLRQVLRETEVPGALLAIIGMKSLARIRGVPSIAVITSPAAIPAFAAGLPASGWSKIAPWGVQCRTASTWRVAGSRSRSQR